MLKKDQHSNREILVEKQCLELVVVCNKALRTAALSTCHALCC